MVRVRSVDRLKGVVAMLTPGAECPALTRYDIARRGETTMTDTREPRKSTFEPPWTTNCWTGGHSFPRQNSRCPLQLHRRLLHPGAAALRSWTPVAHPLRGEDVGRAPTSQALNSSIKPGNFTLRLSGLVKKSGWRRPLRRRTGHWRARCTAGSSCQWRSDAARPEPRLTDVWQLLADKALLGPTSYSLPRNETRIRRLPSR